MAKTQETVLEIDLGNLTHNYKYIRSRIGDDVKFMAVIKAFAYGNDSVSFAQKLETLRVDYLAVAYSQEGVKLRKAGITKPIMVLHPQPAGLEELIENCLEPNLYSTFILKEFIRTAENLRQKDYPVHIKFNTGMNRLGFTQTHLEMLSKSINETSAIKITSVFSHFGASEDWKEREFSLSQISLFKKLALKIAEDIGYQPLLHICNTSGVFNYPEAAFDMVRTGIGLYGYGNDEDIDKKLKPVGTLKTIISQIQHLKKGDTLGYNRTFKAIKPTKIATLPLGYADGIHRKYGNGKTGVFVNGNYAPIVGNICMDILMIDVTDIDCAEGDEVVVFGGSQSAAKFAEGGNTISYELLAGISQRVKRVIIRN